MSDVAEQDIDGDDLLIRSLSSLLSLVKTQAREGTTTPKPADQKQVERLDRLALLFVTAGQKEVVAVAASQGLYEVALWEASEPGTPILDPQGSESIPPPIIKHERRYVVPNSEHKSKHPNRNRVDPASTLLDAESLETLFTRVPDLDTHVKQMCRLINMFASQSKDDARKEAFQHLSRYVYFQCSLKIKSRLDLRVDRGKDPIFKLLDSIPDQTFASEPFTWQPLLIPEYILDKDEAWLLPIILKLNDRASLLPDEPGSGTDQSIRRLDPTLKTLQALWSYLKQMIRQISATLEWIREDSKHEPGQTRDIELLQEDLDVLGRDMADLKRLLYQSPTLWHLLRHSAIQRVISVGLGQPSPPPAGSDPPGVASSSASEYIETPTNGAETADETLEVAEDIGAYFKTLPLVAYQAVGHWLQCLCHWHIALREIKNKYFGKKAPGRRLSIKMVKPPPVPQPNRQASLAATIRSLNLDGGAEIAAWQLLNKLALHELPGLKKGIIHQRWTALSKGASDSEWESLFGGRIHCESFLASLMGGKVVDAEAYHPGDLANCPKAVGVSKRCCFLCDEFLSLLDPTPLRSGSHGKVYPWAPPPVIPTFNFKSKMVQKLQWQLRAFLKNPTVKSAHAYDSGSGSDSHPSGSSPESEAIVTFQSLGKKREEKKKAKVQEVEDENVKAKVR